jgi:hypothetical protein
MNNEESPLKTIISAAKEGLEKTAVLILFVGGLPSTKKIQATSVAHAYLLGEPKDQHSEPAVSTTTRLPKQTAAGGRVILWALPPTSHY